MESVFFDSNPSIRQFTDNASRANSMLHKAQGKESRHGVSRSSRTSSLENADMAGTDLSSGDMASTMDFGDNRGGGSDYQFSYFEHSQEFREQQKEDEENHLNQRRMTDFIKNLTTGAGKNEEKTKSLTSLPESVSDKKEQYSAEKTDQGLPENCSYDDSCSQIPKTSEQEKKEPPFSGTDKIIKEEQPKPQEKIKVSKEEQSHRHQPVQTEKTDRKSEWNSLLTFDEGFLIAQPLSDSPGQGEIIEEEEEVPSFESIELPELTEVSSTADELIASMLLSKPSSDFVLAMLSSQLGVFGKYILKLCSDFGVRIELLNTSLTERVKTLSPLSYCAYSAERKICYFAEQIFSRKESFVPSRFFMAMAFDHALGGENFSSRKSAAVLSNFTLCLQKEKGHLFCDTLAAKDPVYYFAQAVESYLRKEDETVGGNIYSSTEFYDYDRSMYSYIEYLFRELSRGPL